MAITDGLGREISYLRLAVTARCNFRCVYCMPLAGVGWRTPPEILSYEEIVRLARIAVELGVHKVRLTGGEPLVRKGIVGLVETLAGLPGLEEIVLTTNGSLLPQYAAGLRRAGLRRVNVSLDSLRPDRFRSITRRGTLDDTLAGIAAAQDAGLVPIKLNAVVLRGINDDEVADLAGKSREGFHVRFIEWMPIGRAAVELRDRFVPAAEIKARIEAAVGPLIHVRQEGPAQVWRIPGSPGELGLISALSAPFCSSCDRLRLTADGRLRPCLLSPLEVDVKTPLRAGAADEELRTLVLGAVRGKPVAHTVHRRAPRDREMSEIGG